MIDSIEFYNTPDGDVMVKKVNQPVHVLKEKDRDLIQKMLSVINDRYPEAFKALAEIYSKSSMNRVYYEYKMVHRFCRCNFGEYEQQRLDIDHEGMFNFEEVKCPLRGTDDCPYCGVICRPRVNTTLSSRELEILRLIAAGLKNSQISDELHISIFTVIRHRSNIHAKLGVDNTAQMVSYYFNNIKKDEDNKL